MQFNSDHRAQHHGVSPARRPRVIVVAHDVSAQGGMEQALYELIQGAHDQVEFTVVSITLAPELRPLVRWKRVRALRRPFVVKYVTFFFTAGLRYRRREGDLVHTLGAIIPRKADVMSVHFCHAAYRSDTAEANLEADQPLLRRLNIALSFWVGLRAEALFTRPRWARRVTAVSAGGARELQRFYPGLRVSVIANGVDQSRFHPVPHQDASLRRGASSDDVVVLFVGGRWTQKGLEIAVRAMAHAHQQGPMPLVLWVAGAGQPARYEAIARELGAGERIHFLGYVRETERLYQGADIFVLPSAYETFCMVAYEAASSGVPVVATAVNGVEELLADEAAGLMVPATVEAVSAALGRLAGDPQLRKRMGAQGRQRVSDLTWEATVTTTLSLYDELLAQPH